MSARAWRARSIDKTDNGLIEIKDAHTNIGTFSGVDANTSLAAVLSILFAVCTH